jgi:hypothetical protein
MVIQNLNLQAIDVEFTPEMARNATALRLHTFALAVVKKRHSYLKLGVTLSTSTPTGLDADGEAVLKSLATSNTILDLVTINAFNYPSSSVPNGKTAMGLYVIATAEGLYNQIQIIGPRLAKIGIRVMIGQNDVSNQFFSLEDATQVALWANHTSYISLLSYYSVNNDAGSKYALPFHSWSTGKWAGKIISDPVMKAIIIAKAADITTVSTNGACGPGQGICPSGTCCSQYSYCGSGAGWCGLGCQTKYSSACSALIPAPFVPQVPTTTTTTAKSVASNIPENSPCGQRIGTCATGLCCSQVRLYALIQAWILWLWICLVWNWMPTFFRFLWQPSK